MKVKKEGMNFLYLGRRDYLDTLKLQEKLRALRMRDLIGDTFIFVEHNPVITLGLNEAWNKVHKTEEELKAMGIELYHSDRGGGAACLCPGQLVTYSIVRLSNTSNNRPVYLEALEQVAFNVAERYGIRVQFEEERLEVDYNGLEKGKNYRSVWYKNNGRNYKFFAQGHRFSGDVTMYGFTFFVNRESLEHMHLINPCGFDKDQVGVISFEDILKRRLDLVEVMHTTINEIKKVFGYKSVKKLEKEALWQN